MIRQYSCAVLATLVMFSMAQADSVSERLLAVADGQHDATEVIQSALQDSPVLQLPPGVYRLTKTIAIELGDPGFFSLKGDGAARLVMDAPGPAIRLRGSHEGSADPGTFKPQVWERERAPMIDGIEIIGTHPEACGIEATGTMQLSLSRLVMRKLLHAIRLPNRNRNVLITECHLYENRGIGVYLDHIDLHQINITASHISYNRQGGVVSLGGNVRNLHITGCDIESNMSPETAATANVLIDCSDSVHGTAEVAITGCTIQHNSKSPNSANVRILGAANPNKEGQPVSWGNVTITGNVFSDVRTNVHLKACRGVTLTGNTFWMGYDHNLLVENSRSIVIGPNNFDRNPGYDYGDAKDTDDALAFINCDDCTLSGLHLHGIHSETAALLLRDCRRFNLSGCTLLDCDSPALLLQNVSDSLITGSLVRDGRNPEADQNALIKIDGGQGNTLTNNVFGKPCE